MQRLQLEKPRRTVLHLLPLSPVIPLGCHWHHRSWLCSGEDEGCELCQLVPRRAIVYFAATAKWPGCEGPGIRGLFERSAAWYHEACRQSGTNWIESLRSLSITEQVEGKSRTVTSTSIVDTEDRYELVSVERVAFSIAALFQMPKFPSVATVGQAQRALAMFAGRQQRLLLSGAKEVR